MRFAELFRLNQATMMEGASEQVKELPHLLEDDALNSERSLTKELRATIIANSLAENRYVLYKVVVEQGGHTWFLHKRFTDFQELHDLLKKKFNKDILPRLPPRKIFNNFSEEFITKRSKGLQNFLDTLVQSDTILDNNVVRHFLKTDKEYSKRSSDDSSPSGSEIGSSPESTGSPVPPSVDLGQTEKKHVKPRDFDFMKIIGKGSYGKVMLAKHKQTGTYFAVKVLSKKHILRRNETKHIMQERDILVQNLHHPFLVGLHYSFQTSDKLYFVLDYVNGGELFFHLQREHQFTESRARFYAAEITCAIAYLHSKGIIYRDLKPENILLDHTGHIILTDFGLCKDGLKDKETTSTFCGTPEYLAPEVIRKEQYDRTVDWWCLGAVLFEMLTGLPPFYSRNSKELYDNILNKPLRLRPNLSQQAKLILTALLQKDKTLRLGAQTDGDEIKAHSFFSGINWSELELRKVKPPFVPHVSGKEDLRNIDPEFTREPITQSVCRDNSISSSGQDLEFKGFSYVPECDSDEISS